MTDQPFNPSHRRAVRVWLWAVAALVFAIVLVGGATRLTESGLSIVEWKPVTGALPPLSEAHWQAEFEKYKTIPQYTQTNAGMSLAEFKTIFWWEWSHRLLGRLIGAAFLLPFLWFLWRGWIEPGLKPRLWGIFALGAVQGGVGWWMVASGLTERVNVSQYRLAFHLTLAAVIYLALVWTADRLAARAPSTSRVTTPARAGAWAVLVLVVLQIYLGALVAGLRAGLVYNTWPLIDGAFVPDAARLMFEQPAWRNLFENALTVQFNHRMLAYLLTLVALAHAVDLRRRAAGTPEAGRALVIAGAMLAQAVLGILTLLYQVPILMALAHQAMAMVVLALAAVHVARLPARAPAVLPAQAAIPISRR